MAAGVAAVLVALGVIVVVIVVTDEERHCRGVSLRGGAPRRVDVGDRPPIGGGGLRDLRRAFGDEQVAYCDDFADPFALVVDGDYYAYATNSDGMLVPALGVGSLFEPARRHEALANLPPWAVQEASRVWAPAVLPRDGRYVMYYTLGASDDRQCISVATSSEPDGPFVDRSKGPLVCPPGGAIDPSPFVAEDGQPYLLWKDVGDEAIRSSRLAEDGLRLVGDAPVLIRPSQEWEAGLVEGPTMVAHAGQYHLFYSANDWRTADYAVGHAVCETPMGPCEKPAVGPWLASSDGAQGPGGPELFRDRSGLWMVVHAWVGGEVGYPDGARNLFVLRVEFTEDGPVAA